ncbi:MAG: DUF3987 domain-containing protein [Reyranellaceae bacterium]
MPDSLAPAAPAGAAPWPALDPDLIESGRPTLPDFPLDALPAWWRTWVDETAHIAGAPVDYLVQALLAAVAGVAGAGIVARLGEGWDEPPILWPVLVGGPATGKSAALEMLRRALCAVEKTMTRDGVGAALVIDRPTPLPALLAQAGKRPAGALLWRDDPTGAWLAGLGCNGRREPVEVDGLLAGWSPLRSALGLGAAPISLVGCLDPARLDTALAGSDDGRAARLLFAWPAPTPYRSFLARPALRESDAVNALQRIARCAGPPEAPLALELEERARPAFDDHLAGLHAAIGAADGIEAAWLGRGRSTVPRLAVALALLRWSATSPPGAPPPTIIDHETLLAACRLWDHFRTHARAVLRRAFGVAGDRRVRQVVDWLRLTGASQVSRTEIRREALAQATTAQQTQRLIERLEQAGGLRPVQAVEDRDRGRPSIRWDVNPVLADRAHSARSDFMSAPEARGPIGDSPAEIAEIPQGTTPAGSAAQ